MKRYTSIFIVVLLLCGIGYLGFADRGGIGRKNKPQFNIELHGTLKNSIPFNLKSGLVFRGSEIISNHRIGGSLVTESVMSFQKGKTTYLIPYKQRVLIQDYSQNGGYKLIIRPRK